MIWVCRGGFKTLALRLGDKATFDIVSMPKRILISGSNADHTAAVAIIASRDNERIMTLSDAQTECSVCWTEAGDLIRTSCDRVYCAGCFTDLCQAEASLLSSFAFPALEGRVLVKRALCSQSSKSLCPLQLSRTFFRRHLPHIFAGIYSFSDTVPSQTVVRSIGPR